MKNFLLYIICFHLFIISSNAQLGSAAGFTLFTAAGAVGNTGVSTIAGKIGTNVGAVTGFNPSMSGNTYVANAVTAQCAADVQTAFNQLFSTPATNSIHAPAFGSGETLTPGVYAINSAGSVAGALTLDGQGNGKATFIFKINGAFNTAASTTIILTNGAAACNIYWVADGAVAMGASTTMRGTLIANNGAISMAAGGVLEGRMFSTTGAVAVDAVNVALPVCATVPGTHTITAGANMRTSGNVFIVLNSMNIVNNGNINQGMGDGTTILKGNSNTSLSGTGSTTLEKLEVAIENGFTHTLSSTVNIKDVITITSGQYISDGYLVIRSDSINTARVAPIVSPASPAIVGDVVVERYIPGSRKYRLITSSVTTSPLASLSAGQEALSIWGNWQNSGNSNIANSGTIITGGTVADGFDMHTPNVSMYTYDDAGRKYVAWSSALGKNTKYTPLKAGVAYYMFIYGDRTNSVSTSSPKSTVLKQTGTLLLGDQTYNTSSTIPLSNITGRYTLLGNPFASPIDWAAINKTGVADTYWGWDPNLGSTGGYVTVTSVGNSTVVSPLTGTTALNQFIQPGQGFFVKTIAPSPTLTIGEQHKTGNIIKHAFRATGDNDLSLLAVNLQYKSGMNTVLADGALAIFDDSLSNETANEDVAKMVGSAENVSMLNGTELMSINGRKMPANNDTLFLNIGKLTKPKYTLQIFAKHLPNNLTPYLEDNYLHTSQLLATTDTNFVAISITSNAASSDPKRFRIVFHASTVLPVHFISLQAIKSDNHVSVEWKAANEVGLNKYEVERSVNGIDFVKKGELAVHANNPNATYQWTDVQPNPYNYYRVRASQADSKFYFSNVVAIKMDELRPTIKVFPNPIENKTVKLSMKGLEAGEYVAKIINMEGAQLQTTLIKHNKNEENHTIRLAGSMPAGTYMLSIVNIKFTFKELLLVR